ncbi:MAG TPA: DUF72 domain-containing protein [Rhodothermales bacterium]|nr:DUF72 domain-containing protein [Rhodothermales bacterium]
MYRDLSQRRAEVLQYKLNDIHPNLKFGTASDRYAAWIGQVYPEIWRDQVETRTKKIDTGTFTERTLPVASVTNYFQHFATLETDFTFYRAILEPDGKPTAVYYNLLQYIEHAPPEARFLVKAPQQFFARVIRRSRKGGPAVFEKNPFYLDALGYTRMFLEPLIALLGDRIGGVLLQQEYQRKSETPLPGTFIAELDAFFRDIPDEVQHHIEIRSDHLLLPPYFDLLHRHGVGFVFSHWTYLPAIRTQWARCGQNFSAANGQVVLRLLTPLQMNYAEAFRLAYPFEKAVPELSQTAGALAMVNEATALAYQAIAQSKVLHIIANNRAWGNSPGLNQTIANRFLDFAERKNA